MSIVPSRAWPIHEHPGPRTALLVAGAALTLVSLAFLTPPAFFEATDWLQLHQPSRVYAAEVLRAGRLPLWNPYVALGRPFLADTETAVLYPPNLLYLALDPSTTLVLLTVAHYALGLVGMLVLGRALALERWAAWLAAACFLWSAPLVARLSAGQVPYAHATCYVPLVFALGLRLQDAFSASRVTALAAAVALQLLCGHPQIAWVTWVGLAALLLGRSLPPTDRPARTAAAGLGGLTLALLAAFGLAAPMLLPFLELVTQGNRVAPSLAFSDGGSMEGWQWASLGMPDGGRRVFHWEHALYAGLLPLAVGLAGLVRVRQREARGLLLVALIGSLLAAGTRTPAFAVLYHVLPGVSSFRLHSRAALLVVVALILGAALFLSRRSPPSRTALLLGTGVLVSTASPLLFRALAPQAEASGEPFPLTRLVLAFAVACAAGAALLARTPRRVLAARILLGVVVLGELGVSLGPVRRVWDLPVVREGEPPLFEGLLAAGLYDPNGVPPRVAVPPRSVRTNAALLYKWAHIAGYNALTLDRVWVYVHAVPGLEPSIDDNTYPSRRIYDRGPFAYGSMAIVAGWDPAAGRPVLRRDADPRVYLATAVRRVDGWREAVTAMVEGHDFRRTALVESEASLPGPDAPTSTARPTARATIVSFEPERLVVETDSLQDALLVLAEAWYPGWSATVDGAEAPCIPANGWMRAVPVPAGRHTVELRFRSRWLGPGVLLSLAVVAVLALTVRRERALRS